MKLSIQNLLEKLNLLREIIKNQKQENNALRIENLFLKERIHKLKQAANENNPTQNAGERAQDAQYTSNENLSR